MWSYWTNAILWLLKLEKYLLCNKKYDLCYELLSFHKKLVPTCEDQMQDLTFYSLEKNSYKIIKIIEQYLWDVPTLIQKLQKNKFYDFWLQPYLFILKLKKLKHAYKIIGAIICKSISVLYSFEGQNLALHNNHIILQFKLKYKHFQSNKVKEILMHNCICSGTKQMNKLALPSPQCLGPLKCQISDLYQIIRD